MVLFFLYGLLFLGPFQVLSLIIRLCTMCNKPEAYRKNLIKYAMAVPLFLCFYFGSLGWFEGINREYYMLVTPYPMACIYTYIIYKPYSK